MTIRPLDVLDQQVDLIRWWRSSEGQRYAKQWIEAGMGVAEIHPDGTIVRADQRDDRVHAYDPSGREVSDPVTIGKIFAFQTASGLDRAETFAVADTMTEMIFRASQSIPQVPLQAQDLPAPSGWVVFNRSVWDVDIHGHNVSWQAASWTSAKTFPGHDRSESMTGVPPEGFDGIEVTFYTNTRSRDVIDEDTALAEILAHPENLRAPLHHWIPLHTVGYSFGEPWDPTAWKYPEGMHSSTEIARRVLTAFWSITQQFVSREHRLPADRALRRRIERAGLLTDIPKEVRVVTLRKVRDRIERDPDHEPRSVRWSHRWIVSGHWRNQPTRDGIRLIWIDEFEKGPEGLPLVEKDTVYKVAR